MLLVEENRDRENMMKNKWVFIDNLETFAEKYDDKWGQSFRTNLCIHFETDQR